MDAKKFSIVTHGDSGQSERRNDMLKLFKECPIPENEMLLNMGLFLVPQTLSRILFMDFLYRQILPVQGVVFDLGTRWGQNLSLFTTLRGIYEPFNRLRKIVAFDDSYTIKDASMEMTLYHLVNSTHGDGILSVHFPRERVYAEVDVWNPGAQIQPHVRSLLDDITRRGLQIDRILPMHGNAVQPYAEFVKIAQEWSGRRTTATTYVPPAP